MFLKEQFKFFSISAERFATSVIRLGDHKKLLMTNFRSKKAQIFGDLLASFKKSLFK